MIFSTKILHEPDTFDKILVLIVSNEELADFVVSKSEEIGFELFKRENRSWCGFNVVRLYVKSNDIKGLVEKWPPFHMIKDENWDYDSYL